MRTEAEMGRRGSGWTILMWGAALCLLLLPEVAMRLDAPGVHWTTSDFVVFGIMLALACGIVELAVRLSGSGAYRAGVCIAAGAGFLLVWMNLAVGIIGSEDNPANLLFFALLLLGIGVGAAARFRPRGMARAGVAMAAAQLLIGVAALAAGWGAAAPSFPQVIVVLTGFYTCLWLASAWLFRNAARET